MNNKGNSDSKKIIFLVCMILVLMFSITIGTYAYFALSASNNTTVAGVAGTADLGLNVTKVLPSSNTGAMVPQLESTLGTAISSEYNCVDGNNNVVCHVYKIEVTNTGTSNVKVKGTVTFNNPSMPNLKYRMMDDATTLSSETGKYAYDQFERTFVNDISLDKDEKNTFYLVVWIDETGMAQTDSGTYTATINFESAEYGGATSTYVNYLVKFVDYQDTSYFHNETYINNIKNVLFVDYIDISNAQVSWDMSTFQDGGIMAWLEDNETENYYDLYIGSNEVIYGQDMSHFFSGMKNVDNISLYNLDTSQVTSMISMFNNTGYNSSSFTLDLGDKFDTSNVTQMFAMFNNMGYNSTTFTLDLGDRFDTSKVTDMSMMFANLGCKSTGFILDLGDKFDTSNVKSMISMFSYTGYANANFELDLSTFSFESVNSYDYMLDGFKTTQKIYVKNISDQTWITSKGFTNVTTSNVFVKS